MTDTIVVLTEDALADSDIAHMMALHPDGDITYQVLVPADTDQPLLATVLDELGLGDLAGALRRVRGEEPTPDEAKATAAERLEQSLSRFRAAGAVATGEITEDNPLPALTARVADGASEVIVVTYPHLVEDTLHTDWASQARKHLHVPVLHLYSGTSALG